MKRIILSMLFAVCATGYAWGQATPPPEPGKGPPDPQVARFPSNIAFAKAFTYSPVRTTPGMAEAEVRYQQYLASCPRITKAEIVKTGQIAQEIQHMSDGKTNEFWKRGEFSFLDDGRKPPSIQMSGPGMGGPQGAAPLIDKSESNFDELKWVTGKLYTGEESVGGVTCYAYKDPAGKQAAWIDETTRLPMRCDTVKVSILYSYRATPTQPLVLPEVFAKQWATTLRAYSGGPP